MNFNVNFGKKSPQTAAAAARRDREQRQKKRRDGDAACLIARTWRKHAAVRRELNGLREQFDSSFQRFFPAPALKALKLTPAAVPLPPAQDTLRMVLLLLQFFRRKLPPDSKADEQRMVQLARMVSCSSGRPRADQNYCFMCNDTKKLSVWDHTTRRLCECAVFCIGQYAVAKDPSRVDVGVLAKLLLDLVSGNWAYLRMQKPADAYSDQERSLLRMLAEKAARASAAVRTSLCRPMTFRTVQSYLVHQCPILDEPPEKEDLLAKALLSFVIRLCEGEPRAAAGPAAAGAAGSAAAPSAVGGLGAALFAHSILEIPSLSSRIARTQFKLLHAPGLWERVLTAVARDPPGGVRVVDAPPGGWPDRCRAANVIEIGRNVLEGAGDEASDLAQRWVFAVNALLARMPAWGQTKRLMETEPWLERQLRLLWDPSTVVLLFRDLFPKGECDGDDSAPAFTPTTEERTGTKRRKGPRAFFARLRDKARKKETRQPTAAASRHPEARTPEAQRILLESIVATWKPPVWLTSCRLFNTLIHSWSSRDILAALSTRPYMVVALWGWVDKHLALVDAIAEGTPELPPHILDATAQVLLLFLHCYDNFLPVCDDREFYELEQPFPLARVAFLVELLCRVTFRLSFAEPQIGGGMERKHIDLLRRLRGSARSTLVKLSDRNTRRAFCDRELWYIESFRRRLGFEFRVSSMSEQELLRYQEIVNDLPFLIPFEDRSLYLRRLVERDREIHRVADIKFGITIRREFLLEDGIDQFRKLAESGDPGRLRARLHVQFKNREGLEEAGIDAGGVFKEFIEHLVRRGFDPDLGLFRQTEENRMYPNPDSALLFPGQEHIELFTFLGRVLAKAIYEGMTVNLPFADFFLNTMLGRTNFVDDLHSLDPDMYKNLMILKEMDDVEDMCLTFSVNQERLGESKEVDLIYNGSQVDVTNENLMLYMQTLARYKLSTQFNVQAAAFLRGFHDILPPRWVNLFNRQELQQLISGLDGGSWEVADLRKHTKYAGGYDESHQVIRDFWKTMEEFDADERGRFLQFVTSSSKPPLLGFGHLNPPFCIRMGGDDGRTLFSDIDRLPSASTCFNLLKLPPYKARKNMKEKLLYSISSNAGFELS